jgi:aminomethyltransferase
MAELKRTALYDTHVEMGARMVPFAGYEMPVQYESPKAEHQAVREGVGLFDINHMGQVSISGPGALAFLQRIATNDAAEVAEWGSQYAIMCYADGGTVDDIFIYRRPDDYFVVINADNRSKDLRWMRAHAADFAVTVTDLSEAVYMLALQGPEAETLLQPLTNIDITRVGFHKATETEVAGVPTFLSATGYTGEYGYELYFPTEHAEHLWNTLIESGAVPCGLAARDSLRFEACLALYGHELSATISPVEAGLSTFIAWGKGDFIGREALLKQRLEGAPRRLACLEMVDRGVPREGYTVTVDGQEGFVTSGMYCPTADIYAAMALIPRDAYKRGKQVEVDIRGKAKTAEIVKRPFYTPAYRR